jgi:hypothetical protein
MGAWLKAGIIFGVINFIIAVIFSLLLPACLPPIFICVGFICGIVTALFLNSNNGGLAVKESLKAGVFSSLLSFITHLIVASLYFAVQGHKLSQQLLQKMGRATGSQAEKIGQFIGGFAGIACCGVTNVLCFVISAAVGALIVSKLFIKGQHTQD